MPRQPRLKFAEFPWHVVQRGVNRSRCFVDDGDRQHYWALLKESSERFNCAIHAYVLMPNHVHLLVASTRPEQISLMMKRLGQRYTQWFNKWRKRTGPLWEGRFHASLVDTDRYLMICQRYIELNPVRAGIVQHAHDFAWSSHRANAYGKDDLVRTHDLYEKLGPDRGSRCESYRRLFAAPVSVEDVIAIRQAANGNHPLASPALVDVLQTQTALRLRPGTSGRPKKTPPGTLQ